jgi:hypothetical protein
LARLPDEHLAGTLSQQILAKSPVLTANPGPLGMSGHRLLKFWPKNTEIDTLGAGSRDQLAHRRFTGSRVCISTQLCAVTPSMRSSNLGNRLPRFGSLSLGSERNVSH